MVGACERCYRTTAEAETKHHHGSKTRTLRVKHMTKEKADRATFAQPRDGKVGGKSNYNCPLSELGLWGKWKS